MYRAGTVCLAQLPAPIADEHKRHAPPLVLLHMIERTPDAVQERSKIQIVRDDGFGSCGEVFFRHDAPPFGRYLQADRSIFCGRDRKAFFITVLKTCQEILLYFYCAQTSLINVHLV
jgi:hypothetical protein